jgi:hypothetical protein
VPGAHHAEAEHGERLERRVTGPGCDLEGRLRQSTRAFAVADRERGGRHHTEEARGPLVVAETTKHREARLAGSPDGVVVTLDECEGREPRFRNCTGGLRHGGDLQ